MPDLIAGKVAKVLNSRELVINVGSLGGVEVGMVFEVLDKKGENITDPDTGELLGSIDRPKVKVKVTRTEERLSVASTYESHQINMGGNASGLFGLESFSKQLLPPKWVTKYQTLKTNEKTWEDVNEDECYVKTGDPVRQLVSRSPSEKEDGGANPDAEH